MQNIDNWNLRSAFYFDGKIFVSIYLNRKIVFIDYQQNTRFHKSFFCDFRGNIICPSQVNNLLKNDICPKKVNYLFLGKISLIFNNFSLFPDKDSGLYGKLYVNLSNNTTSCIMRILYSSSCFSLGVIEKIPDNDISECLKMIPEDLKDWQKLIINDESIKIYK